jgi:hypothetical protein
MSGLDPESLASRVDRLLVVAAAVSVSGLLQAHTVTPALLQLECANSLTGVVTPCPPIKI